VAALVEQWAQVLGWRYNVDGDTGSVTIGMEDDSIRLEVAFFPADREAMFEFFDRRGIRGGIYSVRYGDEPRLLLDTLTQMGRPGPTALPGLIEALIDAFGEVCYVDDGPLIPVDATYLEGLRRWSRSH